MVVARADNVKYKTFPALYVADNGIIVLIIYDNCGTCVYSPDKDEIGEYSENWNLANLKLYDGIVTLQNL